MSFLLPGFLAAGALIGVPLVLHFLRHKPRQLISFPTLRFLAETAIRETRRHRIQRWITLALRCLIIGLLAAAFARPFFAGTRAMGSRALVIAIDNSYSMQAAGRWETARDWALEQLDALAPGDQAALLLVQPSPAWRVAMTENLSAVRDALAAHEPGFETTRYHAALRIAGETLARTPASQRTIAWMADGQRLGWAGVNFDTPLPAGVNLEIAPQPPAVKSQAAITQAGMSARDGKPAVQATMRLYEPATGARTLSVFADGKLVATRKVELSAERLSTVSVPLDATASAIKMALDPDDLPADDVAYIAPDSSPRAKVLLSGGAPPDGEADFIRHAIESTRALDARPLEAAPLPDGEWPKESVAILRGPNVKRLDDFLARGGRAWLWVDGDAEQLAWLARHGIAATAVTETPAHLRDLDMENPVIEFFGQKSLIPLLEIDFQQVWALDSREITPVAKWEHGGVALGEMSVGNGRVFLCGFAPSRAASDWPVQPSFVPFVHRTLTWLGEDGAAKKLWHVGDAIPLGAARGTWSAIDSSRSAPPVEVSGSVVPLAPGVYKFDGAGQSRSFAVNLATEESDLNPWPRPDDLKRLESSKQAAPVASGGVHLPQAEAEQQQRLWWWLMAAVALFLVTELAVANRTAL